ncbi:MAG: ABC transporter permease [Bdellovibrionaceae bacterium]|nr:ABC transporter permease [Pseudobdellovibrionaceae bacterium]
MIKLFLKNYLFNSANNSVIKIISYICLISSALSVAGLIIVLNIMNDMSSKIQKRLLGSKPHISININAKKLPAHNYKSQWIKLNAFLKKQKNIEHIRSVKKQELIIKTNTSGLQSVIAKEFNDKDFSVFLKNTYAQYPYLKPLDSFQYQESHLNPVYIEESLAQYLQIQEGDSILLFQPQSLLTSIENVQPYTQLQVKGLLPSEAKTSSEQFIYFKNLDKNLSKKIVPIEVQLYEPYQYEKTFKDIKVFAKSINLPLLITNWKQDNHILFFSLNMEKSIMGLFFIISLVINSLSIMTLIFLLITQKRKDIRLLYAIGFSQNHIKQLFMKISFILSLCGMLSGLVIGLGISFYLQHNPLQILPDIFYNNSLSAKVDFSILGLSLLSILFFAYIGAWIPIKIQFQKMKIQYQV